MSLEADSWGRLPQGCKLRICEKQAPISSQVSSPFFFPCRRQKTMDSEVVLSRISLVDSKASCPEDRTEKSVFPEVSPKGDGLNHAKSWCWPNFTMNKISLPLVQKYYLPILLKSRFIKYPKFSEGFQALNLFMHKLHMCRLFWLPIPLPEPFLNLRTNLLVTNLPKMLCGKLTKNKSYFPCGIWSCRPDTVKSIVTLSIFTENHMAMPGRCSSKSSSNYQCESCLLLLFPGTFHSMAAHHKQVAGKRTMLTFGICLFLWGCFDGTVSAISPSNGPLSTGDQSSKTPERF